MSPDGQWVASPRPGCARASSSRGWTAGNTAASPTTPSVTGPVLDAGRHGHRLLLRPRRPLRGLDDPPRRERSGLRAVGDRAFRPARPLARATVARRQPAPRRPRSEGHIGRRHRDVARDCVDAFDLVETPEGWKISGGVYTVDTEGCAPSPLGPAGATMRHSPFTVSMTATPSEARATSWRASGSQPATAVLYRPLAGDDERFSPSESDDIRGQAGRTMVVVSTRCPLARPTPQAGP